MQLTSVKFILFIIAYSTPVKAYTPEGYVGCFKDYRWPSRILNGRYRYLGDNSGEKCKQYCTTQKHRYARTEFGAECYCGNTIREKEEADNCYIRCPGNHKEYCGGNLQISIYDTWRCATHPCKNGATCRDLRADQYRCLCTYEWTGKHCDIKKQITTLKPTTKLKPTTSTRRSTSTTSTTRSTSTATTTKSVKSTKTRSIVTYKSSASVLKTTDIKNHQRSKSIRVTTTEFPKTSTDDTSSSMIPLYVILPLGLIILLGIVAVFLKMRCRQKKESTIENLSHGTGSVPNIYANITVSTRSEQCKTSSNSSENAAVMMENKLRAGVDKERKRIVGQETEDYNTIALRSNTGLVHKNSYDHVAKATDSVDRSYSHSSTVQLNNKQTNVNNTYSHINKASGRNCLNGFAENTDETYNVLELRENPQRVKYCNKIEEYSEYDHADTAVTATTVEDDYSHLNTTTLHLNNNCESNNVLDEDIYYNEAEYATAQKASKQIANTYIQQ